MPIQVIHRGQKPEEVRMYGTCYNCRSVLEANRSDLQEQLEFLDQNTYYHGDCPVCGMSVFFTTVKPAVKE